MDIAEDIELPLQRGRMERVFLNLIGNSLEAMPGGGAIRISARRDGDDVIVEFMDTGPGISEEVRKNLFQPFVSFGKKNGLGLGLALSRQTVLDHGGDMWSGSEPGKGAHFYLRLPTARPAVAAAIR
jgi:signal transduction histidine kinase